MADDIEHRLTTAAEAVREHEVTVQRERELRNRIEVAVGELDTRSAALDREERDVRRLEDFSLTRVLAMVRGSRGDALARERAEAEAARYRVADAQRWLGTLRQEHAEVRARLTELADASDELAAALDAKERWLRETGDPRQAPLLDLATERGRLRAEVREIDEAIQAARSATQALRLVRHKLGRASNWSTYDTFLGGGAVSSAMKHNRLDEAAWAAREADRRLATLRTELADVSELPFNAPSLDVGAPTRFVDIWFDNIFTDLSVAHRIGEGRRNVEYSIKMVTQLLDRLTRRAAEARRRLAEIDVARRSLLTRD